MKHPARSLVVLSMLSAALTLARAEKIEVPEWALPGSATHQQVPPPAGFHRATKVFAGPIGLFEGQADVGGPLLPGRATFDPAAKRYAITSASYNIWYFRDEFRFLWKKLSGDVSLAADISFPNPAGYDDRKVVLIVRQDLDDNAKEVMAGLHGAGLIHLAFRPGKGVDLQEHGRVEAAKTAAPAKTVPVRLGLEKRGDEFLLYVSRHGEPLHAVGTPVKVAFAGPFYVGIGFCSHVPDQADTAEVARVVLQNAAGHVTD